MAAIRLENLHKTYPSGYVAVESLNLEIADGQLIVLVGPSGCGKSTVLRLVAGLETPSQGHVFIDNQDVTNLPPQERDLAMVFQNYALYPHKSVRENLAFGLRVRGMQSDQITVRVDNTAKALGIESLLDRKPAQLSGGQRQRVALGRALVREPKAFLLDEPLSNLDASLRVETRAELSRLRRQLGTTMLYVTHDQEEALTLGDQVAVLRNGKLQQIAPPLHVYHHPVNAFVGGFIGVPAMNFFPCSLQREGEKRHFRCAAFVLQMQEDVQIQGQSRNVLLGVRPHDLQLVDPEGADAVANVEVIEPRGSETLVHAKLTDSTDTGRLTIVAPAETDLSVGSPIGLRFRTDRLHVFDAENGERLN